jgi:hypothetical protein
LGVTLSTWRVAQACVVGTSHVARGAGCEDSCLADTTVSPNQGEVVIAFVADGAGSAKFGGEASEFICPRAFAIAADWLQEVPNDDPPSQQIITEWLEQLFAELRVKADVAGFPIREWSCTLLGAICAKNYSVFLQIGDGAVVAKHLDSIVPVFWPQSGEYANQTSFLVSEGAIAKANFSIEGPVSGFAILSDGLQSLALDFKERTAFRPFFDPLFASLSTMVDHEVFEVKLIQLLSGRSVNQKTDDDKTLVIALRVDGAQP